MYMSLAWVTEHTTNSDLGSQIWLEVHICTYGHELEMEEQLVFKLITLMPILYWISYMLWVVIWFWE